MQVLSSLLPPFLSLLPASDHGSHSDPLDRTQLGTTSSTPHLPRRLCDPSPTSSLQVRPVLRLSPRPRLAPSSHRPSCPAGRRSTPHLTSIVLAESGWPKYDTGARTPGGGGWTLPVRARGVRGRRRLYALDTISVTTSLGATPDGVRLVYSFFNYVTRPFVRKRYSGSKRNFVS